MAIVGMSGKTKPEKKSIDQVEKPRETRAGIIREDSTWYDPSLCNGDGRKCPYLEMNDATEMAMCHKPYAESCLGESLLVQASLMREQFLKITGLMDSIDKKLSKEAVPQSKGYKPKKRIKCRRGGYVGIR